MTLAILDDPEKIPCVGGRGVLCGPHAATHVPLALGLRNDVKRSGNPDSAGEVPSGSFVWSLVRSTVSQSTLVASSGERFIRGRPRAMTQKIARFLAEQQPAT